MINDELAKQIYSDHFDPLWTELRTKSQRLRQSPVKSNDFEVKAIAKEIGRLLRSDRRDLKPIEGHERPIRTGEGGLASSGMCRGSGVSPKAFLKQILDFVEGKIRQAEQFEEPILESRGPVPVANHGNGSLPMFLNLMVDRETKTVGRSGVKAEVNLSRSPVAWHLFYAAFRAQGADAKERFQTNYPGEPSAIRAAIRDLNKRLDVLGIRIQKHRLIDGANRPNGSM